MSVMMSFVGRNVARGFARAAVDERARLVCVELISDTM